MFKTKHDAETLTMQKSLKFVASYLCRKYESPTSEWDEKVIILLVCK